MASHKALNSYYMKQAQGNHPVYCIGPSFQKGHVWVVFSQVYSEQQFQYLKHFNQF